MTSAYRSLLGSTFDFLIIAVLTSLFVWYLQFHWRKRKLYKIASKVQGPTAWPVIGSSYKFMGDNIKIFNSLWTLYSTYPDIMRVWFGPTLVYGVTKPEYLQAILNSPKAYAKMFLYKYTTPLGGHGLFAAPVPIWKRHRKIISPAFNQKVLDRFVEVFSEQSLIMLEQLKSHHKKGTFECFSLVSKCTLDIICETAMGIKVNAQTTDSPVPYWADRLMEIIFLRMFVVWYHFDFIFNLTKDSADERELLKKFHAFTDKVVKEKRAAFNKMKEEGLDVEESFTNKRKAFLDLLLEITTGENKFTDKELRDEVNTFIVAGSDTTAASNCFLYMMLGMHPDIQERVFDEVVEVLGPDRPVEVNDLPKFKYTERVIKESLRLFPIGPSIVRDISSDLHLPDSDIILPKGSSAILGIIYVHRNPQIWPDPLRFDPDRFLPDQVASRHPFAYLPFSGGPRNCIGPKYAMMAMTSLVAMFVRKYKISTPYKKVEEIKLKANVVLRPIEGFPISVELRE